MFLLLPQRLICIKILCMRTLTLTFHLRAVGIFSYPLITFLSIGIQPFQADTFINVSKTFKINQSLGVIIGSQNGTYLSASSSPMQWQNLDYSLALYQVNSFMSIRGGMYWANHIMSGTTDVLGYLPGITLNLIDNTLTLQADYYSGQSSLSGAVVNLQYQAKYFSTYIGVGVPETNSGNEFYGILGFSLSSKGVF